MPKRLIPPADRASEPRDYRQNTKALPESSAFVNSIYFTAQLKRARVKPQTWQAGCPGPTCTAGQPTPNLPPVASTRTVLRWRWWWWWRRRWRRRWIPARGRRFRELGIRTLISHGDADNQRHRNSAHCPDERTARRLCRDISGGDQLLLVQLQNGLFCHFLGDFLIQRTLHALRNCRNSCRFMAGIPGRASRGVQCKDRLLVRVDDDGGTVRESVHHQTIGFDALDLHVTSLVQQCQHGLSCRAQHLVG